MKKMNKLIVSVITLSVLIVTPVFAGAPTTEQMMNELDAHAATVQTQLDTLEKSMVPSGMVGFDAHEAVVQGQVKNYSKAEADNYINYLKQVVVNKLETERIKKEVVDNYTNLSKVSAGFADKIPAAYADYQAAVADRMAAELAVEQAKVLFAKY